MSGIDIKIDARPALAQLGQIAQAASRLGAIQTGVREGLAPIITAAKADVQQPGKPGYYPRYGAKKRKKHLRDTIGQLARVYSGTIVGVVGPQAPAGAHGHNVEHGHRIAVGGSVARQGTPQIKWRPGGPGRPPKHVFAKGAPRSKRGRTGMGTVIGQARAFPFMRPAELANRERAKAIMLDSLAKHVAAAVAAGGAANG